LQLCKRDHVFVLGLLVASLVAVSKPFVHPIYYLRLILVIFLFLLRRGWLAEVIKQPDEKGGEAEKNSEGH